MAVLVFLIASAYGSWFYMADQVVVRYHFFALVGSSIPFLKFNLYHQKIFMGTQGSLLIGLILLQYLPSMLFSRISIDSRNPLVSQQPPYG